MARSTDIRTERLRITPFDERYLTERYVGWLNDPLLMRFSRQRHKRHTMASCREYWRSFEGTPHYFWAIVAEDESPGHIGNVNAFVDEINRIADVGLLIGTSRLHGKGYGSEAFGAVCDFLLEKLELRKVTAGTVSPNRPMLQVMKNTGMVQDGMRIRHYLVDDNEVDVIHMALFREEWLKRHHETKKSEN